MGAHSEDPHLCWASRLLGFSSLVLSEWPGLPGWEAGVRGREAGSRGSDVCGEQPEIPTLSGSPRGASGSEPGPAWHRGRLPLQL